MKYLERRRYRNAQAIKEYRDPARKHLHLLDGGEAWSAAWDFGSLSSDFVHAFNGPATDIGSLSVRPILGGVAYTWRGSRLEATAALTAGVTLGVPVN